MEINNTETKLHRYAIKIKYCSYAAKITHTHINKRTC